MTEMEAWAWAAELNTMDFVIPKERHVVGIVEQSGELFRKSATALDAVLAETPFLVDGRFSVADIVVGYTLTFGQELGWIQEFPHLMAYLERLFEREHCTLARPD